MYKKETIHSYTHGRTQDRKPLGGKLTDAKSGKTRTTIRGGFKKKFQDTATDGSTRLHAQSQGAQPCLCCPLGLVLPYVGVS